ncbi:hypothetical protein SAMN05444161_8869 [Rhizobiales bacterium GAS191]|nr:hypothetical protein SAMN05444161_8869 [Rhizobiales bacterium GAS191]
MDEQTLLDGSSCARLRRRTCAVEEEGLSRRGTAARFGVSYSVAIVWVKRFWETGSFEPSASAWRARWSRRLLKQDRVSA